MFKVLAARIIVFALACVWVFGLVLGGLAASTTVLNLLEGSGLHPFLADFLFVWYLATLVLVGVWVAVKGFKFVGKWEKDEGKD